MSSSIMKKTSSATPAPASDVAKTGSSSTPPIISEKKTPINRNAYESVGGEQPVPGSGIGGGDGKAPVNRNVYEAVAADAKQSVRQEQATTEKAVSIISTKESKEEAQSKRMYRSVVHHRHRRWEQEQFFSGANRTAITTCCGLLIGIILVALIAAGVYFVMFADDQTRNHENEVEAETHEQTDRATYGQEACAAWFGKSPGIDPECVVIYTIISVSAAPGVEYWGPDSAKESATVNTTSPVFCVARTSRDDHVDVCVNGRCDHHYEGAQRLYDGSELQGQWFDNCDEPSPCWNELSGGAAFWNEEVFKRRRCIDEFDENSWCPDDGLTAAIVWLQHYHCLMNGDKVGSYCTQSIPMEMWECGVCKQNVPDRANISIESYDKLCSSYRNGAVYVPSETPCKITCTTGTRFAVPSPVGTPCEDDDDRALGIHSYCALGVCFVVEESRRKELGNMLGIMPEAMCKENLRNERAKRTKKFVAP